MHLHWDALPAHVRPLRFGFGQVLRKMKRPLDVSLRAESSQTAVPDHGQAGLDPLD